eukprot:m.46924 g.46924  ORF g.46924 m.46924 type:complete len:118 (+) comp10947_c0_seq5:1161-1514(+)
MFANDPRRNQGLVCLALTANKLYHVNQYAHLHEAQQLHVETNDDTVLAFIHIDIILSWRLAHLLFLTVQGIGVQWWCSKHTEKIIVVVVRWLLHKWLCVAFCGALELGERSASVNEL